MWAASREKRYKRLRASGKSIFIAFPMKRVGK